MKTPCTRYLAPLALVWTGFAFGQANSVAPALPGTASPNPTFDTDRPTGEETCYPRGTVDADGRIPTDKQLCDDPFDLFGAPDAPTKNTAPSVPETIERQPDAGRSDLPR